MNAIHLIIDYANAKTNPPYYCESQTHWDVSVYLCHKSSQKRWPLQSAVNINDSGPKFYKASAVGNEHHP